MKSRKKWAAYLAVCIISLFFGVLVGRFTAPSIPSTYPHHYEGRWVHVEYRFDYLVPDIEQAHSDILMAMLLVLDDATTQALATDNPAPVRNLATTIRDFASKSIQEKEKRKN